MDIFSAVVVYLMVFWTVLFCILPWGNRPKDEPEKGMAGSAPANPRIKQKFLMTAILSTLIWGAIMTMIHYRLIDWHDMGKEMAIEDYGS